MRLLPQLWWERKRYEIKSGAVDPRLQSIVPDSWGHMPARQVSKLEKDTLRVRVSALDQTVGSEKEKVWDHDS